MKIAIISDIHDNQVNLKKCLTWCNKNKIKNIFCLGDITNEETLEILANGFKKEIFLVRGNAEIFDEKKIEKYANINNGGVVDVIETEKTKIGLCHEPYLINKILKNKEVKYIFYGHTHKPWIEEVGDIKIINPGTLGGVFSRATFAVLDLKNKKLELKILDLI